MEEALASPSDVELLQRSKEEPEAFGIFYDRHVHAILGFFYSRTACPHTAADLTAETFAQAFASRRRFRDQGAPARSWLLAIARHQLSRALRGRRIQDKARRRLGIERVAIDDLSIERIEALADFSAMRDSIRGALQTLSPTLAQAIVLRVGLDLPFREVARRLSCSEGAARVRVARGLAKLAQSMEAR